MDDVGAWNCFQGNFGGNFYKGNEEQTGAFPYHFDPSGTERRLQHFETKHTPQRSKTDLKARNSVTGMHTAIFQHFQTKSTLQRPKTDLKVWNSDIGNKDHTAKVSDWFKGAKQCHVHA